MGCGTASARQARYQVDAERDRHDADQIEHLDAFSQKKPTEEQTQGRHQEVIGARGGRARDRQQMKPQQVAEDRNVFPQGCLYRNRAIHTLEAAGRTWRIAYTSLNLAGIQAAVSVGLGVSILPDVAVLDDHRVLKRKDGFAPIAHTELALLLAPDASSATRRLADRLVEFCAASARQSGSKRFAVRRRSAGRRPAQR